MRRLILGTAGHIDHGKTALVRALTGVDTDRLKEEKARGITIELGFAELAVDDELRFGVVDVPGHEGFVRTMVAGATGMDVVLMVVAADEGVMPQTREHLAIVRLLGVERLLVALTKCDLVEPDWLELVLDDVRQLLADTPYAGAHLVPTSAETGEGLDLLRQHLAELGSTASGRDSRDIPRLPVDRVFTVRGTGTVVTGTLWTGTLEKGQKVRIEPGGPEARVRGLQVHGADADRVVPGSRTAVALVGPDVGRGGVERGQTVVVRWPPSAMLTVSLTVLPGTGWQVDHGQRVRVHVGTSEVMARCVVPAGTVAPGQSGWVQLRLESPVVARTGDALIVRSYSPVTTIAGARVAEPYPAKRSRFETGHIEAFEALIGPDEHRRFGAALDLAGWRGLEADLAPIVTGLVPDAVARAARRAVDGGAEEASGRYYGPSVVREAERRLFRAVSAFHEAEPLRPGMPLEILRQQLPRGAPHSLAQCVIHRLESQGRIDVEHGHAAAVGFERTLTPQALEAKDRLRDVYRSAGMTPPFLKELPDEIRSVDDLDALVELLLEDGSLRVLDAGLYVWGQAIEDAVERITEHFGGRSDLTPSDFREVLPVSRKHLMPLLSYLDGLGVTAREGDRRSVRGR